MKIAVCVCTFRNPVGLSKLLKGIDAQELNAVLEKDISIVVIDNDAEESATEVLAAYGRTGRFNLFAQCQSRRGLSSARNTALDNIHVRESDIFVFIDDDEIPEMGWVEAFAGPFNAGLCSIAVGPVKAIFEARPPEWIIAGDFFQRKCPESQRPHDGYTSNCMIRTAILRQTGIRFEESLNHIGGEDVLFFSRLRDVGFNVRCLPDAIVRETIPANRASLVWLMRRWLRAGITSATVKNRSRSASCAMVLNLCGGLSRVIVGTGRTIIIAVLRCRTDISPAVLSFATVCRGIGMLMAAFGGSYEEYGSSYRPKSK